METTFTLPFNQITKADLHHVGGKGANLGEMTQANFPIPPGFCVTTAAFKEFMMAYPEQEQLYTDLKTISPDDIDAVRKMGHKIRQNLLAVPMPTKVAQAIITAWQAAGPQHSYAVRSSATAEDLPDASFAGQQDTYLNIQGEEDLLDRVRACWVSLFTDRAILYRTKNHFSHQDVHLSVVVQQMILPEVSGILFTADPISGHRGITSIDASYGLGEALVSGLVSADLYKVNKKTKEIIQIQVADKKLAIRPKPEGGTFQEMLGDDLRTAQVLSTPQIRALTDLGSRIEAHYGVPQDIEWCIADDKLYIVQARPITSLFPLPERNKTDGPLQVYISISHAQVMTDPMPPLGTSMWQLFFPFGRKPLENKLNPYIHTAAGRLYLDISPLLYHPLSRRAVPKMLTIADQLIAQAIGEVIKKEKFITASHNPTNQAQSASLRRWFLPLILKTQARLWFLKPEGSTEAVTANTNKTIRRMQAQLLAAAPGFEQLLVAHRIATSIFEKELWYIPPYVAAGILAKVLLSKIIPDPTHQADIEALGRGLAGNVTTEMDLEVGDLADIARQSPDLIDHLTKYEPSQALKTAARVKGGPAFLEAWHAFMKKYGMRGPSEIDITRPRWHEMPDSLLQVVIGNLHHKETGTHRKHHRKLAAEGEAAAQRLITVAQQGFSGPIRVKVVRRLLRTFRNLMPVREHPKFLIIQMMGLLRETILEAGHLLQTAGRLDNPRDIWFLSLPEAIAAFENPNQNLRSQITQRKTDHTRFAEITPPRVMTSEGEIPIVHHDLKDFPAGAIAGSPVSTGVVEGIAKVVLDPQRDVLKPGEILIAPFTDPGWTPLFINAAGLVMEVGGLMTHGSVVAREYGIPAVVSIPEATQRIKTGQRIRVDGNQGYVEILEAI